MLDIVAGMLALPHMEEFIRPALKKDGSNLTRQVPHLGSTLELTQVGVRYAGEPILRA